MRMKLGGWDLGGWEETRKKMKLKTHILNQILGLQQNLQQQWLSSTNKHNSKISVDGEFNNTRLHSSADILNILIR